MKKTTKKEFCAVLEHPSISGCFRHIRKNQGDYILGKTVNVAVDYLIISKDGVEESWGSYGTYISDNIETGDSFYWITWEEYCRLVALAGV